MIEKIRDRIGIHAGGQVWVSFCGKVAVKEHGFYNGAITMAPLQRNAAMEEPFGFMIPETFVHVLYWFAEKLRLLCDRPHPGSPEIELYLEGPRTKKLGSPGDDATVTEMVLIGVRTKGAPIPSDWAPEYCTVGWEDVREPLGPVMQFWFAPLGRETYVSASCVERLATVQCLFENLLKHVEDLYPEIGPLCRKYRTKREMQRIERIERYTKMASGAVVAAIGSGPVTGASNAGVPAAGAPMADGVGALQEARPVLDAGAATAQEAQAPKGLVTSLRRRRGRKLTDPLEIDKECAAWLNQQDRVTQTDFCNGRGISVSTLRRWLRQYRPPDA
jgi:hypothetical protein